MIYRKIVMVLLLFLYLPALQSQDVSYLVNEGESLQKAMKDEEAFAKYQEAIKLAPNDVQALAKCSEMCSIIGNREKSDKKKLEYFNAAKTYAEAALKSEGENAEANFAMAMALGRMALVTKGKEKVNYVKDIKSYADRAIEKKPDYAQALFLLGKWHLEVTTLNLAEKAAMKVLYGGLPAASLPEAILYFEKARAADPWFILNYLELAKAYKENGQSDKAIVVLNRLIKLPPRTKDDPGYKEEGKKLLESLL